jgi:hypothetical protein
LQIKREWTDYDAVKDNETSIPVIKEALNPTTGTIDGEDKRRMGCEEKTSVN